MKIFDTHSHLNFADYSSDRGEVIKRSLDEGVFMINVGTNYKSSRAAVDIANNYENGVWAAIGLHALNVGAQKESAGKIIKPADKKESEFNPELYRQLAASKKVVAIGEIGLDYYYRPKTNKKFQELKDTQTAAFKKQIAFAKELNLPMMFHCRMAHKDLIEILKQGKEIKGAIHCFTGGLAELKEYLDLGLYIGLNGIIYKLDLDEAIKQTPRDRILLETDCPYLSPPGTQVRNIPQNVKIIAQRVSQIRNESVDAIIESSTANAKRLFRI
jgi:TatD DNase family protein